MVKAPHLHVADAIEKPGSKVSLRGWVHRKRGSGGIIFIVLRDRSGIVQIAIKRDSVDERSWKAANDATIESSIVVEGMMRRDERAPTGYELDASGFTLRNQSEPYPITEYQSTELLLDKRHLWLRSRKMSAVMKARSYVFRYAREFLDKQGFFEITPPLLTKAGGETGADMFGVDYFGQKAYLTESSQLYAEAMIYALEKVYSFAPSYRAEKSRTVKHLAEYWHLEPEMAYYDLGMTLKLEERLVSHIAKRLATRNPDVLKDAGADAEPLLKIRPPFKRITYEKALALLKEKGKELKWGDDFGVEEERLLTEDEDKPIFITHMAKELKPFYVPINPKDERTVLCADMLAPHGHGEIIGASERIWRKDELLTRFHDVERAKGVTFNLENYEWYIDLIRYGGVPHSGFGMGTERVIKWMLGLDHIRDAIPFPRMINRIAP